MKKIIMLIGLYLSLIMPLQALGNHNLIDISVVYGGIYENKMVAFFHVKTPDNVKTYWDKPGFGGISPEFSFENNLNMTDIEILYGVPKVTKKAGMINYTLKQDDYIVVTFKPENPSAPVLLKGSLTYGYCDDLCKSGTYQFNEVINVNQKADETLTQDFFATQIKPITLDETVSVNNLIADYMPNKNLLISFQLNGIKNLDLKKFIYYIDTDFEIKTPIIRKTISDRYEVSLDLYDIYQKPETLTLILPNNEGQYVQYQSKIPYKGE
ncbi:MAG: hypothetical protein ACJAQ0_001553 [Dasania sp.]|jgi:hypothetical protein